MSSPESPLSFYESLPPHTRDWLWLPHQTLTLTLDLPTGEGTLFHTRYAPMHKLLAYNVAYATQGGPHAHPAA